MEAKVEGNRNQHLQMEEIRERLMDFEPMLGKVIHNLDHFSTN